MSVQVEQQSFIHNRLVQAAGLGLAILTIAGCTSETQSASNPDQPAVAASAPARGANEALPANKAGQYDVAADYVAGLDSSSISSPVHIPKSLTDPTVRQVTLKAAELKVAADAVLSANNGTEDQSIIDEVKGIQEPNIKAQAEDGVAKDAYASILLDLTNSSVNSVTSTTSFLKKVLADNPARFSTYKTKIDLETAFGKKVDAELNGPDTTQWSTDNDKLNADWSAANDDANATWSSLNDAANAAEAAILDKSPKFKAQMKQSEASSKKDLHHCDSLPSPEKDKCAADEAVSDAQGGYESLFNHWAPMVKDPTQELRVETAAADQAASDAQGGYESLYDTWAKYVHDPSQQSKMEAAAADQAISDTQGNYDSLVQAWQSKVHNAKDIGRIDQALEKEAASNYDQGYTGLGNAEVALIHDSQLKDQAQTHKK